eukprot:scaffold120498_cov29-Tisochrysis_lutea.AAC.3
MPRAQLGDCVKCGESADGPPAVTRGSGHYRVSQAGKHCCELSQRDRGGGELDASGVVACVRWALVVKPSGGRARRACAIGTRVTPHWAAHLYQARLDRATGCSRPYPHLCYRKLKKPGKWLISRTTRSRAPRRPSRASRAR